MEIKYDEKMVDCSVKMVYAIARRIQREGNSSQELFEEYVSIGLIGATKALQSFDVSKGKFSTYAYRCIKNEIFQNYRKRRLNIISLDEKIDEDDKLTIGDTCSILDNTERRIICLDIINLLDNSKEKIFTKKELEVYNIIRYNPDLKQREIADLTGNSRSYVSRVITKVREKMYKLLRKHGYYNIFG